MQYSDDKLIKSANYGGGWLVFLGILSGLGGSLLSWWLSGLENMWIPAATGALTIVATAGYWTLAAAAYRGNERAPRIVAAIVAINLALSVVLFALRATGKSAGATIPLNLPRFALEAGVPWLLGLVILMAMLRSSRILCELQKRGLWDQVFGTCKPSRHLCALGGALLVVCWLTANAYAVRSASRPPARSADPKDVEAFASMLKHEEHDFLAALRIDSSLGQVNASAECLNTLAQKVSALKSASSGAEPLHTVLVKYNRACDEWRKGVLSLKQKDTASAMKSFLRGDEMRLQALALFNSNYTLRAFITPMP